ncbi:MAG TPA: hypothetical protein VMY41_00665 [Thermohalobaculum sp.]|nr:hypothetical protein [Thermohalobaculum sp.]
MIFSPNGQHFSDITGPYKSQYFLPPSDADYLLDYLNQGLARAKGTAVVRSQPSRKVAPGKEGDVPSFSRPQLLNQTDEAGGPKRMLAPKSSTEPAAVAQGNIDLEANAETETQVPGIVEWIKVFSIDAGRNWTRHVEIISEAKCLN